MSIGPKIGSLVLDHRYELLEQAKSSVGTAKARLGTKGECRYCRTRDSSRFRKVAHTFPESLGNKWIISLDECDECNEKFSIYEDSLTKGVAPFLTLGGFVGKGNKTRQTGRTKGRSVIRHTVQDARRHLSMSLSNAEWQDHVSIDPATGQFILNMPIAAVPFVPYYAYKAILKMAYALLPESEHKNFECIRRSLLDVDDDLDNSNAEVGLSFASIGNAPPLVCGTLLRRHIPTDPLPHMIFIFTAGSICIQIVLKSDHKDEHLPQRLPARANIHWQSVLCPPGEDAIAIDHGQPTHLNWSSSATESQPIESIVFRYCPTSRNAGIEPIFRSERLV